MKTLYNMASAKSLSPTILAFLVLFGFTGTASAQDCPAEYDSNESAMNYSLYYESFKNKDFVSARPYLKWVLKCDPGFAGNKKDDRNYERATELYQGLADNAEDASEKRAFLDSALVIFDEAVPTLEAASVEVNGALWILNKARFIQKNADDLPELQQDAGGMYTEVFRLDPTLLEPKAYYVNAIIQDYVNKEDKGSAVDFMEEAEGIMGEDEQVVALLNDWRNKLFDNPEDRMAFLEGQLEDDPTNQETLGELVEIYKELEERDKLLSTLESLMTMAPTPKVPLEIGVIHLEDGDPSTAATYLTQALEMPDGNSVAYEANFNLGIAAQQNGQLSRSRSFFRKASSLRPEEGRPIKAIGDLYAESVRECGSDMAREDRAVYWLVSDYLERAKRVEPRLASSINRELNMYRKIYPAQEDLFFMNWKPGDSYTVNGGCYSWINESTKVRNP